MTLSGVSLELLWVLGESFGFDIVLQNNEGDSMFLHNILATLGFFGGLYALYLGTQTYQKYSLVKNTSEERIRSIALGRTEVDGIVRSAGEPIQQPFSDEECVYAYWRIAEYTPSSNEDKEKSWNTTAVGSYGTQFYLEGEDGRQVLHPSSVKQETA